MEIALAWRDKIEDLAKDRMCAERDMATSIGIEFSPLPLSCNLSELRLKMSDSFCPSLPHYFLFRLISIISEVDVVEDSLLHVMR